MYQVRLTGDRVFCISFCVFFLGVLVPDPFVLDQSQTAATTREVGAGQSGSRHKERLSVYPVNGGGVSLCGAALSHTALPCCAAVCLFFPRLSP